MMTKPIIIELSEIKSPATHCKDLLKPKVARAKRLNEEQKSILEAYSKFKKKYVH